MKFRVYIFFLLMGILPSVVRAQSADEQLAQQYYQNKEFEKAADLYAGLYKKCPDIFYSNYLLCLLQLKENKTAEKIIKKQINLFPDDLTYFVDLGALYASMNEPDKARKQYQTAIDKLSANQQQVFALANTFVTHKLHDYAIETYLRARKLMRGDYPFNFEMAEVYAAKNDIEKMVNEYLDALEINDAFLQSVQNALQTNIGEDEKGEKKEILKTQLLRRIQQSPGKTIFAEMLIWEFIQEKNFEAALIQSKALDKRQKEDGSRVIALAGLAADNADYDVAIECYRYVIAKGAENYYYIKSKMELLNVMNKKILLTSSNSPEVLMELDKNYISTITELGRSAAIAPLLKDYAHLQAFYLNRQDEAIVSLEELIDMPQVKPLTQAECKIELADILLTKGSVWDASLNYSQVEKAYKNDVIGQEAKFKNAKLSYYIGDFMWAKAQLDVLKASTSKLIANDALELSLLITDNTTIDTSTEALMMFASADLLYFRNMPVKALARLDSISLLYPSHSLSDDILYKKYQIMYKLGRYDEAAKNLELITQNYAYDIIADDAVFHLAELNQYQLNNKEKAMELYQQILVDFPGSLYVVDARKRYRVLRGDKIN